MSSSLEPSSSARVVVAVDFGTTFSGFAYARRSEPDTVFKCYEWPYAYKAGAKPYCKTQTSLYYVPGRHGKFELKDWGWCGLVHFTEAARSAKSHPDVSPHMRRREKLWQGDNVYSCSPFESRNANNRVDLMAVPEGMTEKVGYFATKFKLYLAGAVDGQNRGRQKLPGDLTVERMLIDYLQCLSNFIISELRLKYGKHFSKEDVQWCLTVPAIWDESAKQVMKVCAEKAGMVKGAECSTSLDASPYPLDIILEPEAASVYCQQKAKALNLKHRDKLLVADVGGGTIDLVVHEKADDDPQSMRVHEVVSSYGELGGGTFVDSHFFHFLSNKIGCFKEFCRDNASIGLNIYSWWEGIKMGFDGHGYSAELPLHRKLSEAWEKHHKELGNNKPDADYDELRLEDSDIMSIFDPEVDKVLSLIEKQIGGVRVLMVVGGFSASPYLRKRIKGKFESMVEEIIIPEDPGSAICHGAVQLHMGNDIIQSRIAKRTYGISCRRGARIDDPPELVYVDDDGQRKCDCSFDVFVSAGDRVPLNESIKRTYQPSTHAARAITIELYSSTSMFPKFTTETEAEEEGSFKVDISEAMEMDKDRKVEVTMCFGASLIRVSARRVNFGKKGMEERGLSVTFRT